MMMAAHDMSNVIVDTLRMSDRELLRVWSGASAAGPELSRKSRLSRNDPLAPIDLPRIIVRVCQSVGDQWRTYLVKPCDVHGHGMTVLHGSFVHKESRCLVLLRLANGAPTQVPGHVLVCRHAARHVHEVVIAYDAPMSMCEYRFADGSPISQTACAR